MPVRIVNSMHFSRRFVPWLAALLLLFTATCPRLEASASNEIQVESVRLFPPSGSTIWGYQTLAVIVSPNRRVVVDDITYDTGAGRQSLLTANNSLIAEPGLFRISLCAECLHGKTVTVTVTFSPESNRRPIIHKYRIAHLPRIRVTSEKDPSTDRVTLDATGSTSPNGGPLTFEWHMDGKLIRSPRVTLDREGMARTSPLIEVSSGPATAFGLAYYDETGELKITDDLLKCTAMTVVSKAGEKSLLNPEVSLGPTLNVGDKLDIDSSGKLKQAYVVGISFEVRADIVVDKNALIEGQDAAGTYTDLSDPNLGTKPRHGKPRKEPNRNELDPNEIDAPCPTPLSTTPAPKMVTDGYNHHPDYSTNANSLAWKNTPTGIAGIKAKIKGLVQDGGKDKMVWFDQPRQLLPKGFAITKDIILCSYFRAWLIPDKAKCEKLFTIDIKLSRDGTVSSIDFKEIP